MNEKKYSDYALYRRMFLEARPFWPHIAGSLALRLLSAPLALLTPLPIKIAVDSAIGLLPLPVFLGAILPDFIQNSQTNVLILAIGLLIIITLLVYLQGFWSSFIETYTGEKLVLSFRSKLFDCVQRLSFSYHDRKGASDSTYRIQYDAPSIQWITIQGVIPFLTALVTIIGMVYVTARIDRQLALVAMTVAPILFLITHLFRYRIRDEWSKVKKTESLSMSIVQEALSALRVVKAFGQEDRESERFLINSYKSVRGQIRLALINGGFDLLIGVTIAVGTATVLFIGVRDVQSGELTLGSLLIVMAYLAQIYTPLKTVSKKWVDLQASLASAERTFTLIDETKDVDEKPDARPLSRAKGAIAFHNVSFTYPDGQQALRDISFEISPGSRVGISGATGAGKSTLINVLARFYDPSLGCVLLDGVDIRNYKLADIRNQFAIVLQEPVLFSTTIAENIAYAHHTATESQIVEAAIQANAHDFITRLPQGYLTKVGERGMMLSGGQRQRIALARAYLKDAHILILDEPTSSVDLETEAAIVAAMEQLSQGRTTFIISHRASTLRTCDVPLVLVEGQLAPSSALKSSADVGHRLRAHTKGITTRVANAFPMDQKGDL
jgi:ATP-binding cassette, subfamily B, bacterial